VAAEGGWQAPRRLASAFGGCLQTLALCSVFVKQERL